MNYINELIDCYKREKNYTQDKQVCNDLDISAGFLSDIKSGRSPISEEKIIILALGCKIDPVKALAEFKLEKITSEYEKRIWRKILADAERNIKIKKWTDRRKGERRKPE